MQYNEIRASDEYPQHKTANTVSGPQKFTRIPAGGSKLIRSEAEFPKANVSSQSANVIHFSNV